MTRNIIWKRKLAKDENKGNDEDNEKDELESVEQETNTLIFLTHASLVEYARSDVEIDLSGVEEVTRDKVYTLDPVSKLIGIAPVKPFMYFSLELREGRLRVPKAPADKVEVDSIFLQQSFCHKLSSSGTEALDSLKVSILDGFTKWAKDQDVVAPVASFSQGSGSGKSKLAVEVIKDGPGFYIVFRKDGSSGYPKRNYLSLLLKELIEKMNPADSVEFVSYGSCGIGHILLFFAKIVTFYLREWYARIVELKGARNDLTLVELVRLASSEISSSFDRNDDLDCSFVKDADLESFILEHSPSCTVDSIAAYIKSCLDSPSFVFQKTVKDGTSQSTCILNNHFESYERVDADILKEMQECLQSFPFVFILDEANELSRKPKESDEMTGFEVLRRAISYLKVSTKIFFLTLGTKSDVYDLNPPIRDNSKRLLTRTVTLPPITLLSNTSVFVQDKYPFEKLVINHKVLKNPFLLKYLVTLGHPLWTSIPFNQAAALASEKIVNGCVDIGSFDYALVLWMIRAGLMANPIDLHTRILIASHMATVFGFSSDLAQMIVFYPSDPVLALGCRKLLLKPSSSEGNQLFSSLFQKLDEFFEAVKIDRGNLSEVVGTMMVLLAIDQADSAVEVSKGHSVLLNEISETMSCFNDLWQKKAFVLEPAGGLEPTSTEPATADPQPQPGADLSDYKVVTVREFLKTFLGLESTAVEAKLPEKTLDGIVNATHAVKVVRPSASSNGLKFGSKTFKPMNLPLPDSRIPDKNCNLIDEALLKFGLAHQCMFLMPDRYFGFDLIIPVALADRSFTFIGVQFKSSGTVVAEPIRKMQARFHYVKCTGATHSSNATCNICSNVACNAETHFSSCKIRISQNFPSCKKYEIAEKHYLTCADCLNESATCKIAKLLDSHALRCKDCKNRKVECNQCEAAKDHLSTCGICIRRSQQSSIYFNQITLLMSMDSDESADFTEGMRAFASKMADRNVLVGALMAKTEFEANEQLNKIKVKATDFEAPLISKREYLTSNKCAILVSSLWADALVNRKKIDVGSESVGFKRDGFVHRQYCIATRGVDVFLSLLHTQEAVNNCKNILAEDEHFFKRLKRENIQMNALSLLKSIFYDARLNYLGYNYNLANLRQLDAKECGYPGLKQEERLFLKTIIEERRRYLGIPAGSPWVNIIADDLSSKGSVKFERIADRLYKWNSFKPPKKDD